MNCSFFVCKKSSYVQWVVIGGRPKVATTLHHILNKIRQAYAEANAAFFHIVFYLNASLGKLDYPFTSASPRPLPSVARERSP